MVTSAMLRTWPVRLVAIALTLSVRSFQVPATPFTFAWPPSLPSVPTSRATRVTSEAKPFELIDHRVHDLADAQELAAQRAAVDLDRHRLGEVALGDRADHARDFGGRLDHVLDQLVDRADRCLPSRRWRLLTRPRWVILPSLPTTFESRSNSSVICCSRVTTSLNSWAISPSAPGRSSGRRTDEIAAAQAPQRADELAAIEKIPRGKVVHSSLLRAAPPLEYSMQIPVPSGSIARVRKFCPQKMVNPRRRLPSRGAWAAAAAIPARRDRARLDAFEQQEDQPRHPALSASRLCLPGRTARRRRARRHRQACSAAPRLGNTPLSAYSACRRACSSAVICSFSGRPGRLDATSREIGYGLAGQLRSSFRLFANLKRD